VICLVLFRRDRVEAVHSFSIGISVGVGATRQIAKWTGDWTTDEDGFDLDILEEDMGGGNVTLNFTGAAFVRLQI